MPPTKPTLINWSSWIDPERSISDEKNTVWKVLGDKAILQMSVNTGAYPIWLSASWSSWKSIAPLLSVSKWSNAVYSSSRKPTTHFPFPHLVEQGLEFLKSQLSATDNENAAKPTSFPYRALQEEYLQFVERTECLRRTAQTAIPDNQGSHYYWHKPIANHFLLMSTDWKRA